MKNKFLKLEEKRKAQANLIKKIGKNQEKLKLLTDLELRFGNVNKEPFSFEIKNGISFGDVYQFANEHYEKIGINLLDEELGNNGDTLLFNGGVLDDYIKNRKMTQEQYSCFEKVAEIMNSGVYDYYRSMKQIKKRVI